MTKVLQLENNKKYMYEVVTGRGIYYIDSSKTALLPKLFGFLIKKETRPISFKKKVFAENLINFTEKGEI